MYAVVNSTSAGGGIYKQIGGVGAFVEQGAGNKSWRSVASTLSGDVYAAVYSGSSGEIYKQAGGTGVFVSQGAGPGSWRSIMSTPIGDVYAVVYGGDIYKQTGGTGAFVEQGGAGNKLWYSITSTPNGDVYAVVSSTSAGGGIYKQTGGIGAFVEQGAGNKSWRSVASTLSGDVYAAVYSGSSGEIYKLTPVYGLGGSITISSSQTQNLNAGSGSITITGGNPNLSNNTYTASGGINISGSITTNPSTYIYTSSSLFSINNNTYTYPSTGPGYNGVYNPTIYYFSNITDTDWNTLTNWCTIAFCGNEGATSTLTLPTSADQVMVNGDVLINSGLLAMADTVVFNNTSTNAIDINAVRGITFNDLSINTGASTLPIANFDDESENTGTIFSNIVTFYNDVASSVVGKIKGYEAIGDFVAQNAGNKYWYSITSTPNGDVYADSNYNDNGSGGDIYKQTGGIGAFVAQNAGNKSWYSIASTPNGDIYATDYNDGNGGDIYKQTGGTGAFVAQNAGNKNWYYITSTRSGDIYANVAGGDIYKQIGGTGAFVAQGVGNKLWSSIISTPSGDIYTAAYGGDIYKQTGGTGAFVAQGAGNKNWSSITSTPNGDVYIIVDAGDDIYKQTGGTGAFVAQDAIGYWATITSTPSGDVYAVVNGGDIYKKSSSPILQRIYTESATTSRIFASTTESAGEAGHSDWIIIAQRAVGSLTNIIVNLTSASYNLVTNIFKAMTGATFISGTDINGLTSPVVPEVTLNLPTQDQTVIKWLPNITWGDAELCEYSYDNWSTGTTTECSLNGADIERPQGGANTLIIRATNQYGSFKEEEINFTYDNISPVYTFCGTDLLDESTREYYYLASGTTDTCTATVNTKLYGNTETTDDTVSGTPFTIANTFEGNGHTITLKNIIITGTTTSNGGTLTIQNATTSDIITTATTSGANAGDITISSSSIQAIFANGSNNNAGSGGSGGAVTIATSTTNIITSNGGTGTTPGGNGGTITIWNSDGILANTLVTAIGGNTSLNCGTVGVGGSINITNSNNYTAESIDGTGTCQSASTGGTRRTPVVTTRPVTQSTNTNTNTNTNSGTRSFNPNTINQITLPVQKLNPINLTALPKFGTDTKGSFSLLTPIKIFLFSTTDSSALNNLKKYPKLQKYITDTLGFSTDQKLISLYKTPLKLDANAGDVLGIFKVISPKGNALVTTLKIDKKGNFSQYIKVNTKDNYQTLNLQLATTSKTAIEGKLNDTKYTFTNSKDKITTTINIPQKAGTYTFTTSASPLPLVIEVVGTTNTNITDTSKGWWGKVKGFFGW